MYSYILKVVCICVTVNVNECQARFVAEVIRPSLMSSSLIVAARTFLRHCLAGSQFGLDQRKRWLVLGYSTFVNTLGLYTS